MANQEACAAGILAAASSDRIPEVPAGVVARARWLGDPRLGELPQMRMEAFDEVVDLVGLVCGDFEGHHYSAAPNLVFGRLTRIAVAKPDLLQMLVQRALRHPLLIAELATDPPTCGLACWLLTLGSRARAGVDHDASFDVAALAALEDGLGLLQRFLGSATNAATTLEAADLLAAVFDQAGRPRRLRSADAAEDVVVAFLAQPREAARAIVEALAAAGPPHSLDAPAFVAALELVVRADLVDDIAPDALPEAYIAAVGGADMRLSADRMSPARAAALFRLAKRCGGARLSRLLYPVDWRAKLSVISDGDYDHRQEVVRSIEAGTRSLANAVIGLADEASSDLVAALAAHVSAGSEDDLPNGRISAFGPASWRLPWSSPTDASIGSLLGRALSALDAEAREDLLLACLNLREPVILADIYRGAPRKDRQRIRAHLEGLGVDGAAPAHSWPMLNERVATLVAAGLTDLAEAHLQAAKQGTTLGKIAERPRNEFGHALSILSQKGDWSAIAAQAVPPGLPQVEREACERILANHQAIALLQEGKPEIAVERLQHLVSANPAELGFQVNLFAARISAALGTEGFPILPAAEQRRARQLSAEVESWMATHRDATDRDRQICSANLAALDLAVGDPQRALSRLGNLSSDYETVQRAVHEAVAYARLGKSGLAHQALDKAVEAFGDNPLLQAARGYLVGDPAKGGMGAASRVLLATSVEDLQSLRAAMSRFGNSTARDKAAILRQRAEDLPALLADYVDDVLAGVANLAPLLRSGVLPDDEDDITAIVKQLLNARLHHLGWSTPDQCKGGYTPSGNYGERDLVLVDGVTELAVLEAVIANRTVPKEDLTSHFRKLLGYGDCPLYFHLTYAWSDDTSRLIEVLEEIAAYEAPNGYVYEGREPVQPIGNRPKGFAARYSVAGQQIQVVFRVLDLGQRRLRDAAASSAQKPNKPSRKPKAGRAKS